MILLITVLILLTLTAVALGVLWVRTRIERNDARATATEAEERAQKWADKAADLRAQLKGSRRTIVAMAVHHDRNRQESA